ncbi:MAG: Maf family protein [Gammaproteobacteria bacterium]
MPKEIILASASPRRAELLDQIGVHYRQLAVDIDETPELGETAENFVTRLAIEKACAGLKKEKKGLELPVLGADTIVVIDDKILGKPSSKSAALEMLQRLSGRQHRVLTAVALISDRQVARMSETTVWFRTLTPAECLDYWVSGEPADKAGSYAIQGQAAAFIERIEGSYSGVMGLPLFETAELLSEFNIPIGKQL